MLFLDAMVYTNHPAMGSLMQLCYKVMLSLDPSAHQFTHDRWSRYEFVSNHCCLNPESVIYWPPAATPIVLTLWPVFPLQRQLQMLLSLSMTLVLHFISLQALHQDDGIGWFKSPVVAQNPLFHHETKVFVEFDCIIVVDLHVEECIRYVEVV